MKEKTVKIGIFELSVESDKLKISLEDNQKKNSSKKPRNKKNIKDQF